MLFSEYSLGQVSALVVRRSQIPGLAWVNYVVTSVSYFCRQVVLADPRTVDQLRSLHRLVARRHQQQQHQHQRGGPHQHQHRHRAAAAVPAPGAELHVARSSLQQFSTPVEAAAGVLAALAVTP